MEYVNSVVGYLSLCGGYIDSHLLAAGYKWLILAYSIQAHLVSTVDTTEPEFLNF
jgi:hypothetical protein